MMSADPASELRLYRNREVCDRANRASIVDLVDAATRATFYRDGMPPEQVAANQRIPSMGAEAAAEAAISPSHHLAAAFEGPDLAGFVIATRHAPDDLELDWLMVHPRFHGNRIAGALMREGIGWLGEHRPMWLTVIQHNQRAIAFYRKFGFEIDRNTRLERTVPTFVMRRPAATES